MTDLIGQGAAAAPMPQTIEGLQGQNRAYRTLCASLEAQMAILTEKGREYHEAVTMLDSERAANAIMTDEIAALRARVAELEGVLRQIAKPAVGLQAIQEDYGHDTNAYNFQAMKYFTLRCHRLQSQARAILSKQEPGRVEVVDEGESP